MDIIEFLIDKLGVKGTEREIVQNLIIRCSLERAIIKLHNNLSNEEKNSVKKFWESTESELDENINNVFIGPAHKQILIDCVIEMINYLLEDQKIVLPDRAREIKVSLTSFLIEKGYG